MTPVPPPVRSWPRAAALALAALYVPQLLPLAATDLLSHDHCLVSYGWFFPILIGLAPGLRVRMWLDVGEPGEEIVLVAVATAVTLVVLGGTALALRKWRHGGPVVALLTALLAGSVAMFAVAILRA